MLPCLLQFKFALHAPILFASFVCMYFYPPLGINYCKKKKSWFLFIVAFVCQIIPVWRTSLHRGLAQKWGLLPENNPDWREVRCCQLKWFQGAEKCANVLHHFTNVYSAPAMYAGHYIGTGYSAMRKKKEREREKIFPLYWDYLGVIGPLKR